MLLTCTHTAAYERPVAQFSIRCCICTAVVITPKLNAEELVGREVHKEKALRMGYLFVRVAVNCCESLTLKMIVQSILCYVVFLEITVIFDFGCVMSVG